MAQGLAKDRRYYAAHINRVLDYIAMDLSREHDLATLARVAAFSPFHFHRVFKAVMGETVAAYVARVRLAKAAYMLAFNPDLPVTTIALECGFSSSSNFARAFKAAFGASASAYRKDARRKIRELESKLGEARASGRQYSGDVPEEGAAVNRPEVAIIQIPAHRVAYVRRVGPYEPKDMREPWERLIAWATSNNLAGEGALFIGVEHDDPTITAPAQCRYDACLVVGPEVKGGGDVGIRTLRGGLYAEWRRRLRPEEFWEAWERFYSQWLLDSGYEPDAAPTLELYYGAAEIDGTHAVGLCIPIKPL